MKELPWSIIRSPNEMISRRVRSACSRRPCEAASAPFATSALATERVWAPKLECPSRERMIWRELRAERIHFARLSEKRDLGETGVGSDTLEVSRFLRIESLPCSVDEACEGQRYPG